MRVYALTLTCIVGIGWGCGPTDDTSMSDASGGGDAADESGSSTFDVTSMVDLCGAPPSLDLWPLDTITLVDRSSGPHSVHYSAQQFEDCGPLQDVTAETTFSIDDTTMGTFTDATFIVSEDATRFVAKSMVRAHDADAAASTSLTVVQYESGGPRPDPFFHLGNCGPATQTVIVAVAVPLGAPLDVRASAANDPTSVTPLTSVLKSVRAMSEGSSTNGCVPSPAVDTDGDGIADTFTAVDGTNVCFEIVALRGPCDVDFAWGRLEVVGNAGAISIDERRVVYEVTCTGAPC